MPRFRIAFFAALAAMLLLVPGSAFAQTTTMPTVDYTALSTGAAAATINAVKDSLVPIFALLAFGIAIGWIIRRVKSAARTS